MAYAVLEDKVTSLVEEIRAQLPNRIKEMTAVDEWVTTIMSFKAAGSKNYEHWLRPYTEKEIKYAVARIVEENTGQKQKVAEPRKKAAPKPEILKGKWEMLNDFWSYGYGASLSNSAIAIWCLMFKLVNQKNSFEFPLSYSYISEMTGISDRHTISKAINQLIEKKLLIVTKQPSHKAHTSTRYQLLRPEKS